MSSLNGLGNGRLISVNLRTQVVDPGDKSGTVLMDLMVTAGGTSYTITSAATILLAGAVAMTHLAPVTITSAGTLGITGTVSAKHGVNQTSAVTIPITGVVTLGHGVSSTTTGTLPISGTGDFVFTSGSSPVDFTSSAVLSTIGTFTGAHGASVTSVATMPLTGAVTLNFTAPAYFFTSTGALPLDGLVSLTATAPDVTFASVSSLDLTGSAVMNYPVATAKPQGGGGGGRIVTGPKPVIKRNRIQVWDEEAGSFVDEVIEAVQAIMPATPLPEAASAPRRASISEPVSMEPSPALGMALDTIHAQAVAETADRMKKQAHALRILLLAS